MKGHTPLIQEERDTVLEDDEYANMLQKFLEYDKENHYTSNFAFFIKILMFTGVRWGQLQLLEFSDINFDESRLEFPAWKCKHIKKGKQL